MTKKSYLSELVEIQDNCLVTCRFNTVTVLTYFVDDIEVLSSFFSSPIFKSQYLSKQFFQRTVRQLIYDGIVEEYIFVRPNNYHYDTIVQGNIYFFNRPAQARGFSNKILSYLKNINEG